MPMPISMDLNLCFSENKLTIHPNPKKNKEVKNVK